VSDIPHFSLPFRFAAPQAATNEQDSIEEIADCVLAILACPAGYRVELPEFGLPDPVFSTPGVDTGVMRQVIETWEPRAATSMEQWLGDESMSAPELVAHIETLVQVRTEA
jgi:phage baseplate assembly protein W